MSRQVIETIWQDLRYGSRGLLHAPGFVLTVTGTIALDLGVNTALFTLFDANYPASDTGARSPLALRNLLD